MQGELTIEEVVAALRVLLRHPLRTTIRQLRAQEQVVNTLIARGLLSLPSTPSSLPIAHRLLDMIG